MVQKYLFFNDYSEGAHPRILDALAKTNLVQELGYGEDSLCVEATHLIKTEIANPGADIHFVSGGTQANLTVLASLLRPYESIVAPITAHINIHEAGAIEATGHKIHGVPCADGKLTSESIREVVAQHTDEHIVKPKAVFISHATEVGTVYKKEELEAISKVCKELNLHLYLDGARLGSALVAADADLKLPEIAKLADVFYIGGTKNGALIGEAIVIINPSLKENFRYYIKQRGGLLAKGRILGAQFLELFKDGLFLELARHANMCAGRLSRGIAECGYTFLAPSSTNQIFPIF